MSLDQVLFPCAGVLLDLDGVLVDSSVAVERAWRGWAAKRGVDVQSILLTAHGRRTEDVVREFAPHLPATSEAARIEEDEVRHSREVVALPGALELVRALPEGAWAVVTSGTRPLAGSRIRAVGLPIPDVFVTAEDVTRGKPDPEGYLAAAKRLGARPEDCVVLEDAPAGIGAALAAGMRVVAVATTHRPEELSGAHACVDALTGVLPRLSGPRRLQGLAVTGRR